MRFNGLILGIAFLSVFIQHATAQGGETAATYSLIVYNPARSLADNRILNGGGASVGYNLGEYLTVKGEIEGYASTTVTFRLPQNANSPAGTFQSQGSMVTYLFGPQINIPGYRKRVFCETLFGIANTGAYANLFKSAGVTGLSAQNSGFAMAIGGGLDIGVAKHVALRVAQVDYLMTRYEWKPIGINNQSNFRFQTGLVFGWGGGE